MNLKINGFKVSVILPRDILANIGLAGFQAAMVSNLTAPDCPEAKTFMRLVVDDWGSVTKRSDSDLPSPPSLNLSNDMSKIEFERLP